jgi:hypothetical protein
MTRTHNKRRNAGLMYEFLVRTISGALVEGDNKKSSMALKILKRHFKPGTELYREFRLINALVRTTVSSESVATSILSEAKNASREYKSDSLDREKSLLIKNINYSFRDPNFYDQHISEYKAYATAQTLVNGWRTNIRDRDIKENAHLEDQMVQWLMSEKSLNDDTILSEEPAGTSRLLMKVMTQKLNEKYSGFLNDEQKSIIKNYAFSSSQGDNGFLVKKLNEIKTRLIENIDDYSRTTKDKIVLEKICEVKDIVKSENINEANDEIVTRFMLYARLLGEITSEE